MVDRHLGHIDFELVSPTKLLISEPVDMVVVPGVEGDIGVLPGHSPLIATVRPGIIEIYEADKIRDRIFIAGGFAEVSPNRCTVLAEEATRTTDINLAEAEARLVNAQEKLKTSDGTSASVPAIEITIAEGLVAAAQQAQAE